MLLAQRVWHLQRDFWRHSPSRTRLLLGYGLLVAFSLCGTRLQVALSFASRQVTNAVLDRSEAALSESLFHFAQLVAVALPLFTAQGFLRSTLNTRFRMGLTRSFVAAALRRGVPRALRARPDVHPEAVLVRTVGNISRATVSWLMLAVETGSTLVAFSSMLYDLAPRLLLFIAAYATVGTLVTHVAFARGLAALNERRTRTAADYRRALATMRSGADGIVMLHGEASELKLLNAKLDAIGVVNEDAARFDIRVNAFTRMYDYGTVLVPIMSLAPLYFADEIDFGAISQASMAFSRILSAASTFAHNVDSIQELRTTADRVEELIGITGPPIVCDEEEEDEVEDGEGRVVLTIDGVTVAVQETLLLDRLDFELEEGDRVMISGESGVGKTSLFYILAGLDAPRAGTVTWRRKRVMFTPQVPYLCCGSLRDQLTYGMRQREAALVPDEMLREALDDVGLSWLLTTLGSFDGTDGTWTETLSPGESQRLAFARILVRRPTVCLLDESTSSLDGKSERAMYGLLQARLPGLTMVSISHRDLSSFHTRKLLLSGGGTWSVVDLPRADVEALQDAPSAAAPAPATPRRRSARTRR